MCGEIKKRLSLCLASFCGRLYPYFQVYGTGFGTITAIPEAKLVNMQILGISAVFHSLTFFCPSFPFAVLIVVTARGKVDRQHGVLCLVVAISSPRKR
jgi:hypothetical protein